MEFLRSLSDLNNILKWIVVTCGIITAIISVFLLIVSGRRDELKKTEDEKLKTELKETKDSLYSSLNEKKKSDSLFNLRLYENKEESQKLKDSLKIVNEKLEPLKGREITLEQEKIFISFLKNKPKGKIDIWFIVGDKEANEYKQKIVELLKKAKYIILDNGGASVFGGDEPKGIFIDVNSEKTIPIYAEPLQDAFDSIGIIAEGRIVGKLIPPFEIGIFVGHK